MENSQISHKLKRLAELMSLLQENPYKVRSFQKAARIVRDHPEDMGLLVDENRLKDVPGIGPSLACVIMYYAKAGMVGLERELEAQLPEGLPDLLDYPGLGTKKLEILWQENHITTPEQLMKACKQGQVASMKGFGAKLQQNLLDAHAFKISHAQDFYLDLAQSVAAQWRESLSRLESIDKCELTGSVRRGNDLIQSIDFLVVADMSALIGEMKASWDQDIKPENPLLVKDASEIPVQLWVTNKQHFALDHLLGTGGESLLQQLHEMYGDEFQQQIKSLAEQHPGCSERDLCSALNIQWLEPELRDSYTTYPVDHELIQPTDIRGVFHAHSTWSDGRHSLEDLAEATRRLGYEYLGITEHSQAAYYANGLKPDRVRAQWELIDELNAQYDHFHIFKGIEADILSDGRLDYDEELLSGFDFVIASIHSHFHLSGSQQTERISRALLSPFTTILGHPTGRMLKARPGYAPDLDTIIDVAVENDKMIEINTTPKRLDLDWRYMRTAREKGLKISINPDAHQINGLKTIPLGVQMARKGGFTAPEVLNTMPTDALQAYLESRRVL